MRKYIEYSLRIIMILFALCFCYACANIGNPNGGPYDETPPKFVSSTPFPNQINYKGKTVDIIFDEIIQLDNPSENVIITPPQRELPIVRGVGKKIHIELLDTLEKDMTYTIDFTNSIADNNEKNVYENFTFAFSTGQIIDTLEVSGTLLNAFNLEPMPGITVGLHRELDDSAFVKLPFFRTSRTNDRGRFTIRNIAPGKYRIYALKDVNRDYKFDQPGEEIAFTKDIIVPSFEPAVRQDTIWKDSLTIDTVKTVHYTRFMPDDIVLRLFKEDFVRQYMLRPERPSLNSFVLKFNSKIDTIPATKILNAAPQMNDWFLTSLKEGGKNVEYWILDSTIRNLDTLKLEVTYPKSDSLNHLVPQTDTISIFYRRPKEEKKKKKRRGEEESVEYMGMNVTAPGALEVYDTLKIMFSEPVLNLKSEDLKIEHMQDSIWHVVDFSLLQDTLNKLQFYITHPWKYGEKYRLTIDSAAITGVYNRYNAYYKQEMKVKKEEDYGDLYINISGIDAPAYVELLTKDDSPIRKVTVKNGGVLFPDLKPGKYYARIVIDRNNNGKWDTGKYIENRQPEEVYYYPKELSVMQNWDVEEYWTVNDTPLDKQKLLIITKNKPKEINKQKRDYKNEGRNRSSRSSGMGGIGGMGGIRF